MAALSLLSVVLSRSSLHNWLDSPRGDFKYQSRLPESKKNPDPLDIIKARNLATEQPRAPP